MDSSPGEREFLAAALTNPIVREVLRRAETLRLPDWYLAAGCLFQTVWNVLDGQDPEHGIGDYDLIYFDAGDLSWDAEDVVIRRCAEVFGDSMSRSRCGTRPGSTFGTRTISASRAHP
jgi:hypothetical protein